MNFIPFSLNISGKLIEYQSPAVMGIVNVTPDSFFGGSRTFDADAISIRVQKLIDDGADMFGGVVGHVLNLDI